MRSYELKEAYKATTEYQSDTLTVGEFTTPSGIEYEISLEEPQNDGTVYVEFSADGEYDQKFDVPKNEVIHVMRTIFNYIREYMEKNRPKQLAISAKTVEKDPVTKKIRKSNRARMYGRQINSIAKALKYDVTVGGNQEREMIFVLTQAEDEDNPILMQKADNETPWVPGEMPRGPSEDDFAKRRSGIAND